MRNKDFSNIEELEAHLSMIFKGMFKSKEMYTSGVQARRVISRYVEGLITSGSNSGYNYNNTGDLHRLISDEVKDPGIKQTPSSITMGFGELTDMNDSVYAKRNYQEQSHVVGTRSDGTARVVKFRLKAENEMPKWILAEFGSGDRGDGESAVPKEFNITYTKRPDKKHIFGPSIDKVGGPGGGKKKSFFMTSKSNVGRVNDGRSVREHPGTKAGHVFSDALKMSKIEVEQELAEGIHKYLARQQTQ
jgi:hypothetical protein